MKLSTALMWFDNSPKVPLAVKIEEATSAYEAKFGRLPNVCYVNPADCPEGVGGPAGAPAGVAVETEASVLPHHLYIGVMGSAR